MIVRHIVLIKFRSDVSESEISDMFRDLDTIGEVIDGVLASAAGRSESPEQIERGYMHGFTVDFDGWEALQRYQEHPLHKAFGAKLVGGAVGGLDGLLVFDLPVPAP